MQKTKVLKELRYNRDENGSHTVEHHYISGKPETHRFARRNSALSHLIENSERIGPSEGLSQGEEKQPAGRPFSFASESGSSEASGRRS